MQHLHYLKCSAPCCCFEYRINPHEKFYSHGFSCVHTFSRSRTLSVRNLLRLSSEGLLQWRWDHVSIHVLRARTCFTTTASGETWTFYRQAPTRLSYLGTTRAEQTHPEDWSIKDSVQRRRLLWFSSGLICSLFCLSVAPHSLSWEKWILICIHVSALRLRMQADSRGGRGVCWRRCVTSLIDLASSASCGDLKSWDWPGVSVRFAGCRSSSPPGAHRFPSPLPIILSRPRR